MVNNSGLQNFQLQNKITNHLYCLFFLHSFIFQFYSDFQPQFISILGYILFIMNQEGFTKFVPVQPKIFSTFTPGHTNTSTNPYQLPKPRMSHHVSATSAINNPKTSNLEQPSKITTNSQIYPNTNNHPYYSNNLKTDFKKIQQKPLKQMQTLGISATNPNPGPPKGIPTFLQTRNNMKNSMYLEKDTFESSKKGKNGQASSPTTKNIEANQVKRYQRPSEHQDMRSSSTQIMGSTNLKVPSFIYQKGDKKQKKAPYQTEMERPQSSKQHVYKLNIPIQSLSNSYGSMRKSKMQFDPVNGESPTSEWAKKSSWGKRKDKGVSINDFQKISDLGSGKYGQVYLARQKKSNFVCAVKIVEKKLIRQQQIIEQFIREIKIQSYLNHPNIIRMYGYFDDQINIYILLEVGTGGQLFKQLKKHQSMPEPKVAGLIRQVCQAVNQLHSYHIIHRDIKPQNIVLNEGVVKLCDFGWSVYSGSTLRTTFCGSPLYVGPQILKGNQYDQKIDIWSLGVMMYEMLIGQNPFKITKEEELIKIVKDEIKIPGYVQLSNEAKEFLLSCLQKNPEKRPSIRELLNHDFFKKYPEKTDKKMGL